MRVGRDGRFGLRLGKPGTGKRELALDYRALGDEQAQADAREERRLFYVAMTRARERLVLSGAAKLDQWPADGGGPIGWIGPAVLGEVEGPIEQGTGVTDGGVRFEFVREAGTLVDPLPRGAVEDRPVEQSAGAAAPEPPPPADPGPPGIGAQLLVAGRVQALRYRFYAERVLGLPPVGDRASAVQAEPARPSPDSPLPTAECSCTSCSSGSTSAARCAPTERADRGRARAGRAAASRSGTPTPRRSRALVERFGSTELCARLAARDPGGPGGAVRVPAGGEVLIVGAMDVFAREPGGRVLVVDYKTDRLDGADPAERRRAPTGPSGWCTRWRRCARARPRWKWRTCSSSAPTRPWSPCSRRPGGPSSRPSWRRSPAACWRGEFPVTDEPQRSICQGCPAEGGLCSWPLEMTRRDAPDRLF